MEKTVIVNGLQYTLRTATAADLPTIMRHRRNMYTDMGFTAEGAINAMATTSAPLIKEGLEDGSFRGWLVEVAGEVVAGGGIVVLDYPSSPRDPNSRRAFIVNMFTEPGFRNRGLARLIMEEMIHWCREQKFAWVALHASNDGRHLYEKLGFKSTNEMRLELR